MPAELPAQRGQQPDQGVGHRGQRLGHPLIRLGDPFAAIALQCRVRVEQVVDRHLRHIQGAAAVVLGGVRQVDLVLFEGQRVQPAGLVVDLLAAAVDQQHPRAGGAVDQPAAFGKDGRMGRRITRVVHQNAAQRAIPIAGADIDRELFRQRGKHAVLQQEGCQAVADFPLIFLEGAHRSGHAPDRQAIAQDGDDHRNGQRRPSQRPGRETRGAHHCQFPVAGHPLIDELDHDIGRDRQDDHDEAGYQQRCQAQEHQEGQAAIDHQVDEAQRLGQPDKRRQPAGGHQQRGQNLPKDVNIQPGHELAGAHAAFCAGAPCDAT